MKKRFLAFIICAVMVLSMLPFGSFASSAAVTFSIDSGIEKLIVHIDGDQLYECVITQSKTLYYVSGTKITVSAVAKSGYSVSGFNDSGYGAGLVYVNSNDEYGASIYDYSKTLTFTSRRGTRIDYINIFGNCVPIIGHTPGDISLSGASPSRYSIGSYRWYELSGTEEIPLNSNQEFQVGKKYFCRYTVEPENGYFFSENIFYYPYMDCGIDPEENSIINGSVYVRTPAMLAMRYISSVDVPDFSVPRAGETVSDISPLYHETAGYTINGSFEDLDTESPEYIVYRFESGHRYYIFFSIDAKNGYSFDENTVVTVGGSTSKMSDYRFLYGYNEYAFQSTVFTPLEHIDSIYLNGYQRPVSGRMISDQPMYTIDTGAPYAFGNMYWYNDTLHRVPSGGELFNSGYSYSLGCMLLPEEGYYLDSDTAVYINGSADNVASVIWNNTNCFVWGYSEYPLNYVTEISLSGFEIPRAGEKAGDRTISLTADAAAPYTASGTRWYNDTDHRYMNAGDEFEEGKLYSLGCDVTAGNGYLFSSNTAVTINGSAANTGSDSWLRNENSYSVWSISVQPLRHIDTVRINGYRSPGAGMDPSCWGVWTAEEDAPYTVDEFYWCDEDEMEIMPDDGTAEFVSDHEYACGCVVNPAEGYYVDENTAIYINGKSASSLGAYCSYWYNSYVIRTSPEPAQDVIGICIFLDRSDDEPAAGIEILRGEVYGLPAEPGRDGYVFGGWYTDRDLQHPYDPAAPIMDYTYLFPKWIPESAGFTVRAYNYDLLINNAQDITAIRIAPGELATSGEIKNAPGCINLSKAVIDAHTDPNNMFRYELADGGIYSVWIKASNGEQYVFCGIDVTYMEQDVFLNGPTLTVTNLYGVKDIFVKKGVYSTYAEMKDNPVVRIYRPEDLSGKSYTYGAPLPGEGVYTVMIRYNDPNRESEFRTVEVSVTHPRVSTYGRYIDIANIDDVRVIRVAPGTYSTSNEVKNAQGCRNFTSGPVSELSKDGIFSVLNVVDETGADTPYTVAVQYRDGYIEIVNVTLNKIMPVYYRAGSDSITFTNIRGLVMFRYAPGTYSTVGEIKQAPGNRYIKPAQITDDELTVTGLSGSYSFFVQYDDESKTVINLTF